MKALLLLLPLTACATPSTYELDSESVPQAVGRVADGSVQLLIFPERSSSKLLPNRVSEVRDRIEELHSSGTLEDLDRLAYLTIADDLEQADGRRDVGLGGRCWGFLAEPDLLVTCRHNLEDFSAEVGSEVRIVLLDADWRIAFDSREGEDVARVERAGELGDFLNDVALVRLSRSIDVRVLPVAEIGTGDRAFIPHVGDEGQRVVSIGKVQPSPMSGGLYRGRLVLGGPEFARRTIHTDIEGGKGLSGSPILDQNGRVVGITIAGTGGKLVGLRWPD